MYKILWIKVCMCVHVILCIQNHRNFAMCFQRLFVLRACVHVDLVSQIMARCSSFFFLELGALKYQCSHTPTCAALVWCSVCFERLTSICAAQKMCAKIPSLFFCKLCAFEYPYFHTFTWAALVCFLVHLCSAESVCKSFACIFFFELRCPEVSVLCLCAILPHPVFSSDAPLSIRIPTHLHIHTMLGALKCQYSVCVPVSLILLAFIPAFFSWVTHP